MINFFSLQINRRQFILLNHVNELSMFHRKSIAYLSNLFEETLHTHKIKDAQEKDLLKFLNNFKTKELSHLAFFKTSYRKHLYKQLNLE